MNSKITDRMQQVAVSFLEKLVVLRNFEITQFMDDDTAKDKLLSGIDKIIEEGMEEFKIESDPFTSFPCTTKEYLASKAEYERQTADGRYGHHDWLD